MGWHLLPRIARTPSPPLEYLRRRQDMGGASLPPYPEDYNTTSKSSSPTLLSQTVKRRRPKKSFGLGRRNKQTGPVDPSEVVPYPENEDDMLDAIVVEGGVLVNGLGSTEQSGTQSRQKRRRVGSQTVPSRGKLMKVGGKPVIAASAGHSPSPVEGSKVNTKKTPPARLLKQPHEEENAPSVECSHRELMATAEAMLSLNGQNNHASVDDRGREISDGALQHTQDMQGEGADSDSTIEEELTTPFNLELSIPPSLTSPDGQPGHAVTPPSRSRAYSDLSVSVRRSARQPVKSSKMRNRSYSPTKIEFHVSRFDGRMGGFKLTGRDLFRNGRWNWKRLESRIVDTALFDAKSGDELLINYKFSVYDMSELRLCSEEFESNSSNEILVVRTNEEGHYPEKVYEAMKEQQRQTRPSSGHQSRSFNGGILSNDAKDGSSTNSITAPESLTLLLQACSSRKPAALSECEDRLSPTTRQLITEQNKASSFASSAGPNIFPTEKTSTTDLPSSGEIKNSESTAKHRQSKSPSPGRGRSKKRSRTYFNAPIPPLPKPSSLLHKPNKNRIPPMIMRPIPMPPAYRRPDSASGSSGSTPENTNHEKDPTPSAPAPKPLETTGSSSAPLLTAQSRTASAAKIMNRPKSTVNSPIVTPRSEISPENQSMAPSDASQPASSTNSNSNISSVTGKVPDVKKNSHTGAVEIKSESQPPPPITPVAPIPTPPLVVPVVTASTLSLITPVAGAPTLPLAAPPSTRAPLIPQPSSTQTQPTPQPPIPRKPKKKGWLAWAPEEEPEEEKSPEASLQRENTDPDLLAPIILPVPIKPPESSKVLVPLPKRKGFLSWGPDDKAED